MWALIKWGIWQRRWFIFWWCLAIAAFIFVNMIFYPSFRDQAAELEKSFKDIPDSGRALFSDTGDFFSPIGYLSSQIFYLMLPMLMAILSIVLGSSLLAKEEKDGTIELLLSRPISRTNLLIGKALVGINIVLAACAIAVISVVGMAKLVKLPVPAPNIVYATLAATALGLCFGAIAFMIASLGKARVASVGIATLIALGGFIINSLTGAASWLKWPSKALPFHYYHAAKILEGTYEWKNMLFIAAVAVLCSAIALIAFRRRDISS